MTDLNDAKREAETRSVCEWDRRGNVVVTTRDKELVAVLYTSSGKALAEYVGSTPQIVLEKMFRDDCLSQPNHWTWVALELANTWMKVQGEICQSEDISYRSNGRAKQVVIK